MKKLALIIILTIYATSSHAGTMIKVNRTTGTMTVYGEGITKKIVEQCKKDYSNNIGGINQCIQDKIGTSAYPSYASRNRRPTDSKNNDQSIRSRCQEKWGSDYRMVQHCIDKHTAAKNHLTGRNTDRTILKQCQEKWGSDYRMVEYCVDKQTAAKRHLKQ